MKKWIKLCCICFSLCLIGCQAKASTNKLTQIKTAKKIIVGLSPDYPPYEFYIGENGKVKIVGSDVALAEKIAEKLGVELEIVALPFDSLLAALNANRVDMIISGMNPSDERRKVVDFSERYYISGSVLIQKEGDKPITSEEQIKSMTIGVQKGTIQETYLKETLGMPQERIHALPDSVNVIQDLKNGQIDIVFLAEDVSQLSIEKQSGLVISNFKLKKEAESDGVAIAFKKGNNAELIEQVNQLIRDMSVQDDYLTLLKQYGKLLSQKQE